MMLIRGKPGRRFWKLVVCLTFVAAFFSLTNLREVNAKDKESSSLYDELKVFTDVLAIVQRDYVQETGNKKLVEGAIKGLLSTLDPHSGYLDPDFYQDLQVQTKGEFGGLGIEITIKDGLLVVVSPMEGSPAERAGIKAGDTIVKIDGKFTKEFSLVDAVKKLRGPKGTTVSLSMYRKGRRNLFDVNLVRDNIQVRSVRSRYLGDGFGLVRINQFMEKTSDDVGAALRDLSSKSPDGGLHGLVIDLRNNPGGLLNQAIKVCDFFIKNGVIVYTDGRVEAQKQKFFAHGSSTEPEYPVVVVVNGGSASASEIVAGALKDHGRAVILGTRTFGKGSVQTITPLGNGGAVTLTTALYYTKSGRSIQGTGVTPDIEVLPLPDEDSLPAEAQASDDDLLIHEDDLPGAIQNPSLPSEADKTPLQKLNKTPTVSSAPPLNLETAPLDELFKKDAQLQRAFDLLKTFNIFGSSKPPEEASPAV